MLVLLGFRQDVLHLRPEPRQHQVHPVGGLGGAAGERRCARRLPALLRHSAASSGGGGPWQFPASDHSTSGVVHQVLRLLQALDAEGIPHYTSAWPALPDSNARSLDLRDLTGIEGQGVVRSF